MSNNHNPAYWLIELLAWWEGKVQPSQLATHWQCTRQHASSKLKAYLDKHPDSLKYVAADKNYQPVETFNPRQISREANEYLNWLTGYSPSTQSRLATWTLQPPPRKITPLLMRPIVRALREKRRLEVDYGSVSSGDRNGRIIVPHHLVKTSARWHLRAWCEQNQQFRDFVLSRFHGVPELLDKSDITHADDEKWNKEVEVILAPDPRLTPEKKRVIEQDYEMENGQLTLKSKACMVHYLLHSLNVDPQKLEGEAEAQQVIVVNISDIKKWLFS